MSIYKEYESPLKKLTNEKDNEIHKLRGKLNRMKSKLNKISYTTIEAPPHTCPEPEPHECPTVAPAHNYPSLNPTGDPVGGNVGYSDIINPVTADYVVGEKSDLLAALISAQDGDIIYIEDNRTIDLTAESNINIPGGVTLCSGRGYKGSQGGLLYTNYLIPTGTETQYRLFIPGGDGVRVTGLRLFGGDIEMRRVNYDHSVSYGLYSSYDMEVDNSELYGFSQSAVYAINTGLDSFIHVHHNHMHHNLREGLGYAIAIYEPSGANSMVLVEANLFNWNRHSITASGTNNMNYTARYNVDYANYGNAFDVHGNSGPPDYMGGVAGNEILIYENTIYAAWEESTSFPPGWHNPGIGIRGIPNTLADIHDNYFVTPDEYSSVRQKDYNGDYITDFNYVNMLVHDNHYGYEDISGYIPIT